MRLTGKAVQEQQQTRELSIVKHLRLAVQPNHTIHLDEIERAARRWPRHTRSSTNRLARMSRVHFVNEAIRWLTCLNRLQAESKTVTVHDRILADFKSFMKDDRGLSQATVIARCSSVWPVLIQLLRGRRSFEKITVSDVDSLLSEKGNEQRVCKGGYLRRQPPQSRLRSENCNQQRKSSGCHSLSFQLTLSKRGRRDSNSRPPA